MSQPNVAIIALSLFTCIGCQTVQVRRAATPATAPPAQQTFKTEKVPGIPFYIKRAACLHTVTWLEPVYTLTLELVTTFGEQTQKTSILQLGSYVLSLSQLRDQQTKNLFHILNTVTPDKENVVKAWIAVGDSRQTPYTPNSFPEANDRILIANTNEPQVYVDYNQPYYLNAKRPVAGSVKIDEKLASDGTLTEVSVELEDKTIEAIATGIASITSAVGTAAKSEEGETAPNQSMKLTVTTTGFKHSLSTFDLATLPPCAALGEVIAAPYKYSRVEVNSADDKKADAKSDAKGSKITLSGEIVLPVAKETPAAPAAAAPKAAAPVPAKKSPK
jgi:hypothetical protein